MNCQKFSARDTFVSATCLRLGLAWLRLANECAKLELYFDIWIKQKGARISDCVCVWLSCEYELRECVKPQSNLVTL